MTSGSRLYARIVISGETLRRNAVRQREATARLVARGHDPTKIETWYRRHAGRRIRALARREYASAAKSMARDIGWPSTSKEDA